MSCDVVVAIEINHLPQRIVENKNPCKSPRTVVRTAPWAPWFMRNLGKKRDVFLFHGKIGWRKLLLCSDCSAFSLPTDEHQKVAGREAVTLADREGSCDN